MNSEDEARQYVGTPTYAGALVSECVREIDQLRAKLEIAREALEQVAHDMEGFLYTEPERRTSPSVTGDYVRTRETVTDALERMGSK